MGHRAVSDHTIQEGPAERPKSAFGRGGLVERGKMSAQDAYSVISSVAGALVEIHGYGNSAEIRHTGEEVLEAIRVVDKQNPDMRKDLATIGMWAEDEVVGQAARDSLEQNPITSLMTLLKVGLPEHIILQRAAELLEQGADPNETDRNGYTILMLSAEREIIGLMEMLLDDKRIEIDKENPSGGTALMVACVEGKFKAAELLISRDADVNGGSSRGSILAATLNFYDHSSEIVQLLKRHGARM